MKYKPGDKFIIEIESVYNTNPFDKPECLYRIKGFNSLVFDVSGLDKLEKLAVRKPIDDFEVMNNNQKLNEIDRAISEIIELFDIAWEYNKSDKSRTELSQKCTMYLSGIGQTLGAIRDELELIEEEPGDLYE